MAIDAARPTMSPHAVQKYWPPLAPERGDRAALCLAGCGFRGLAFHLGALRRANELGLLKDVAAIAGAGAGAVAAAWLASRWPDLKPDSAGTFAQFEDRVLAPLFRLCRRRPHPLPSPWRAVRPQRAAKWWRGQMSSADGWADWLDRKLFRGLPAADLAGAPALTLLCSDRHGAPLPLNRDCGLRLAEAVSAAWAPNRLAAFHHEGLDHFGGAHADPLALEPVWRDHGRLLAIDAGRARPALPRRRGKPLPHEIDVAAEAARRSRKQWLMTLFATGHRHGAYLGIDSYHGTFGLPASIGYPAEVVAAIAALPSAAAPLRRAAASVVANHGYTLADTALRRHWPGGVPANRDFVLPFPDLAERGRVDAAVPAAQAA